MKEKNPGKTMGKEKEKRERTRVMMMKSLITRI
jgi:hypothetical protein